MYAISTDPATSPCYCERIQGDRCIRRHCFSLTHSLTHTSFSPAAFSFSKCRFQTGSVFIYSLHIFALLQLTHVSDPSYCFFFFRFFFYQPNIGHPFTLFLLYLVSMSKARNEAIIHISLLVLIQWISIAVMVLNAISLKTASGALQGIIATIPGPQDYLLIVLGAASLLAASLLLCLHLHVFFRLIDNRPFAPSKAILAMQMTAGVMLVALWASATSIVMTSYNGKPYIIISIIDSYSSSSSSFQLHVVSSACRITGSEFVKTYGQACDLINLAIILGTFTSSSTHPLLPILIITLAFVAMAFWVFVILATLCMLIQSSLRASATVFTVENLDYNAKQSPSTIALRADKSSWTMQSLASYNDRSIVAYPSAAKTSNAYTSHPDIESLQQQHDEKSRNVTKSWCSEYSTHTASGLQHDDRPSFSSSFEPVSLDDLPCIQEGMSQLDLAFLSQSYDDKKTDTRLH